MARKMHFAMNSNPRTNPPISTRDMAANASCCHHPTQTTKNSKVRSSVLRVAETCHRGAAAMLIWLYDLRVYPKRCGRSPSCYLEISFPNFRDYGYDADQHGVSSSVLCHVALRSQVSLATRVILVQQPSAATQSACLALDQTHQPQPKSACLALDQVHQRSHVTVGYEARWVCQVRHAPRSPWGCLVRHDPSVVFPEQRDAVCQASGQASH